MTLDTKPRTAAQFLPFTLGRIVVTLDALHALRRVHGDHWERYLQTLIVRHRAGDWGIVDEDNASANDRAIITGARVLSVYAIDPKIMGDALWIITEADRSHTTILLPDEY